MKFICVIITAFFLVSCVSGNGIAEENNYRKMRTLSSKVKQQEREIDRLKAKNEVLKGQERPTSSYKRMNISSRAKFDLKQMTEVGAYKKLLKFYKNNDERSLKAGSQSFMKKYPRSTYSDNVYYMIGSLKLKQKDYVKSIRYFDKVAKSYPNADKAPFAIFAKGLVYKKLGLKDQAKSAFTDVSRMYPSSAVAKKASKELRIFK